MHKMSHEEAAYLADYEKVSAALTVINERADMIEGYGRVAPGVGKLADQQIVLLASEARDLARALYALKRRMQGEMDSYWPMGG